MKKNYIGLECFKKCDNPQLRFFCFPYAGGGSYAFRQWAEDIPDYCELNAIVLPGREKRQHEAYFTSIQAVVQELMTEMVNFVNVPFVFFGHSMGALLAFALTREFQLNGLPLPVVLGVSACQAPQNMWQRQKNSHLSDAELRLMLRKCQGTPEVILDDNELAKIFIPRLRSDIKIIESYEFQLEEKLQCPILGFYGIHDHTVSPSMFGHWRELSAVSFASHGYLGGHFYINQHKKSVVADILQFIKSQTSTQSNIIFREL